MPNIIGSFASGATTSIVAKNQTKNLSQPFKELQDLNLTLKQITPKSTSGTYCEINLSSFGVADWPMAAIFDF